MAGEGMGAWLSSTGGSEQGVERGKGVQGETGIDHRLVGDARCAFSLAFVLTHGLGVFHRQLISDMHQFPLRFPQTVPVTWLVQAGLDEGGGVSGGDHN